MTTSMYCLYVGFDYTYIDVNALAQGIKSFLASLVWSQAVAGARTYGTDSPAITSQPRYPFGRGRVFDNPPSNSSKTSSRFD